jgi:hypothetical protein
VRPFAGGCPISAVAVLFPHRTPLLLGPVETAPLEAADLSRLAYPADGSIVTGSAVDLGEAGCSKRGPVNAHAQLRSLSLFGGVITAARLSLSVGVAEASTVVGLTVAGKHTAAPAGARVPLQRWGYLVVGPQRPVYTAADGFALSTLAVHLIERHAGLPAGTVVLVTVAGLPAARAGRTPVRHARKKKRALATHEPLKVTPPLGLRHYVFPVAGQSDYVDTYGAFRSDVPGNWHHGDDIFAPLGTPVVAVASGTINRVGWEHVGGWRLWVRDRVGDEFYYAHLSGYAPTDLHSNRVKAGEVIGFIGNTGDAFSTSPHLHFEVHPRQLLHLGYDGAVDPTSYLNHWTHLTDVHVPPPAHPPLPSQPALKQEARYVWRELLAARHLIRHAPSLSARPHIHIPTGVNGPIAAPLPPLSTPASSSAERAHGLSTVTIALLAALVSLAMFASTILLPVPRRGRVALGWLGRLGLVDIIRRRTSDRDRQD